MESTTLLFASPTNAAPNDSSQQTLPALQHLTHNPRPQPYLPTTLDEMTPVAAFAAVMAITNPTNPAANDSEAIGV